MPKPEDKAGVFEPLNPPELPLEVSVLQIEAYDCGRFSKLAYDSGAEIEAALDPNGYKAFRFFEKGSTQAFGVVCGSSAVLSFRGTETGLEDWWINLQVWVSGEPGRHAGFNKSWRGIAPDVTDWLRIAAPQWLILTGHSLGGAIATVAAYELNSAGFHVQSVVTFGSPRVASIGFAQEYARNLSDGESLNSRTHRFVHANDVVTIVPPPLLFRHVGRKIELSTPNSALFPTPQRTWFEKVVLAPFSADNRNAIFYFVMVAAGLALANMYAHPGIFWGAVSSVQHFLLQGNDWPALPRILWRSIEVGLMFFAFCQACFLLPVVMRWYLRFAIAAASVLALLWSVPRDVLAYVGALALIIAGVYALFMVRVRGEGGFDHPMDLYNKALPYVRLP